jgi:16S rRNA C967 or C1407 C5-methylase (RsmB/RsmF family)/NOL1/NOP2/fmu family ribosome biogenesis protein
MNLPADFTARTQPLLGEQWDNFVKALNEPPPVSIRLNRFKTISEISYSNVPWCDTGYYLDERPRFTFDPLFHAGCYYVQEASSMFVGQVLEQYAGQAAKVLDLCAAPGGKSTLAVSLLDEDSLLISNEVIRSRANILSENMIKWGNVNTVVTNNDPSQIGNMRGFFDIILVDAPCSGEGMFRKDEGAVSEWSADNVRLCKERQQRILADIWPALKNDGILIYSTCTYNQYENEQNAQWIRDELGADILPVNVDPGWGISPSLMDGVTAYRFFPHKTKGEGFFCAVFRKNGGEERNIRKPKSKEKNKTDLPAVYKNYLSGRQSFTFYPVKDRWFAFPSSLYDDLLLVKSYLSVVSEGICLGEFKGKDFIPNQSLAFSNVLNKDTFVSCEVDLKTAIVFLRRETVVLDGLPKGYILLTFKDVPLGFVKNIGSRTNNLYPQEWRIRSAYVPDQPNSSVI